VSRSRLVITRLNQDFNAVLQMPDVRSKLTAAGLELLGGTPQQLDDLVKADHQRYGTLASELKIKVD
jgi:tripartite-type tricarboxylate transporter receptor subunit TctC